MDKETISGNTITIPPHPRFLATVDEFIEGFLLQYGADNSTIADIAISVSELVNNAISHGSRVTSNKLVVVKIGEKNGAVKITVTDRGAGFNPDDIADPLAEENLLKEAGRGIFIVRSLMDTVDIKATEHGTTVTITKAI